MRVRAYHGTRTEFIRFNLGFTTEIGFHFGSRAQAKARINSCADLDRGAPRIILECEIDLQNPIVGMPDIDDWGDHQSIAWAILESQDDPELLAVARRYRHMPYRFDVADDDLPRMRLRQELMALGYDGATYANEAEGPGESYLVFSTSQIEIVARD
jgi:hypothetical protein